MMRSTTGSPHRQQAGPSHFGRPPEESTLSAGRGEALVAGIVSPTAWLAAAVSRWRRREQELHVCAGNRAFLREILLRRGAQTPRAPPTVAPAAVARTGRRSVRSRCW